MSDGTSFISFVAASRRKCLTVFQNEAPVKHGDRATYPLARISRETILGAEDKEDDGVATATFATSLGQNWVGAALGAFSRRFNIEKVSSSVLAAG